MLLACRRRRAGARAGLSGEGARRVGRRRHGGRGARRACWRSAPISSPRCAPPMRRPSVVVGKRGTATVSVAELRVAHPAGGVARRRGEDRRSTGRSLDERLREWRAQGLRIGFTNGCFDLLHPGHVKVLAQARARLRPAGGRAQQRRLGASGSRATDRPIQDEHARAEVLAALEAVDLVVVFERGHAARTDPRGAPDACWSRAATTAASRWSAARWSRPQGGEVILVDLVPGHSTTGIVAALAQQPPQSRPSARRSPQAGPKVERLSADVGRRARRAATERHHHHQERGGEYRRLPRQPRVLRRAHRGRWRQHRRHASQIARGQGRARRDARLAGLRRAEELRAVARAAATGCCRSTPTSACQPALARGDPGARSRRPRRRLRDAAPLELPAAA